MKTQATPSLRPGRTDCPAPKSFYRPPSLFHRAIALLLVPHLLFLGGLQPRAYAAPPTVTTVTVLSSYDGNGNVIQRTDGNGVVTAFGYDAVNRLISIDYPGGPSPDVSFTYDQNGNRTRMVDATGTTNYTFDLFDRLTRINYPDGGFVDYGYDNAGNVTDLKYGNTAVLNTLGTYTYIQYTYDPDNRISSVKNVFSGGTTTAYTYNDAGAVSRRTLPNGVTSDYGYDTDGRLVSVFHRKADTTLICGYTYTLNAIGNRTQVVESLPGPATKTTSYTYDPLERLDIVTYPSGRVVNYDYDSFGNRTKMTETVGATTTVTDYFHDSDSRLLSTKINNVLNESFYYDATGNLVQRVRASDNRQINYLYDFENHLVRYYDGTSNVQYLYDGSGQRVAKVVNGVRTNLVNDPNRRYAQVLTETDISGNAQRVYEWGNELIVQKAGAFLGHYLHDAINGSVTRIVDSTSSTLNTYDYDAFGAPTAKTEGMSNDYQFDGEFQDEETGLVFLRARYLEPSLGRFLSRDPVAGNRAQPQTLPKYTFAGNDPVNHGDPSGMATDDLDHIIDVFTHSTVSVKSSVGDKNPYVPDASIEASLANGFKTSVTPTVSTKAFLPQDLPGKLDFAVSGDLNQGSFALDWGVKVKSVGLNVSYEQASGDWNFKGSVPLDLTGKAGKIAVGYSTSGDFTAAWKEPFRLPITVAVKTSDPLVFNAERFGAAVAQRIDPKGFSGFGIVGIGAAIGQKIGGVALNKSASVLLDINNVTGGTYDTKTGQLILFGKPDASPTALPKMSLDDLAVAFKAVSRGAFPVVSIEDPVVDSPPEWPGRKAFTVRYGPFVANQTTGLPEVLDLSSKTHFGWVMFEADRLMKCLGLGKDNRTGAAVSSTVGAGTAMPYKNLLDLAFENYQTGELKTRYWFNPKEIVIEPSADGKSMQLQTASMQLSTETMFSSNGQVESTPDAEYFANWFTTHYDAIAEEQISYDGANQPHKIFKELKQLAYLAGIVKWVEDNKVPIDLSFLANYQPANYPEAPAVTPQTSVTGTQTVGNQVRTIILTGGVNYCNDLDLGTGGNPTGIAAAATASRPGETSLAWSFNQGGNAYNATAISVDRTQKDGGSGHSAVDAAFQAKGAMPLALGRYFDSFNLGPTLFGWGWKAQPYALEFKGNRSQFMICHQTWEGYGEVNFVDRASQAAYKFVPAGTYNTTTDPLGIASRFDPTKSILVYRYQTRETPGLLFSDNTTRMTMRLANGMLLDFDLDGLLTRTEDRNGNRIDYGYDGSKRLATISQTGTRSITLNYDGQNRVATASLPGGRTVTYSYDGSGNLSSAQADAPTGRLLRYAYDADHRLVEVQDENGNATAHQNFDVYGRATSVTQPGVATNVASTYSLENKTSQTTGPEATSQAVEFNANNDPIKFTDARNNFTTLTYNGFRQVTSTTRADLKVYRTYYDSRGMQVGTVSPNGRADFVFTDLNGNPITSFHGPTSGTFDAQFDADKVLLPGYTLNRYDPGYTQYFYDAKGNLTKVTDANAKDRLFGYDAVGNLSFSKDGRGKQTDYTYDTFSRLTRVRNAMLHEVNMTYDTRDNLSQVATAAGTVDYGYNAKNQVTSVTSGNTGARRTTNYTYDAKGSIKTVTDPNSKLTEYGYDARGNLTEVKHDSVVRFTYQYDGLNRLVSTAYSGTAGGGAAAIVPVTPQGTEGLRGSITITWKGIGDWSAGNQITIQYSTNGTTWNNVATVNYADGSYVWNTGALVSSTVRIRFVRTGDATFVSSQTPQFQVVNGGNFYVNNNSTTGDQYCTAAGQAWNGTTVTGTSPSNPVLSLQDIFDHYMLQPGDQVFVDAGSYTVSTTIQMSEADRGTVAQPVRITGPTNGQTATFSLATAGAGLPVMVVYDSAAGAPYAEGIIIENLRFRNGNYGLWLSEAWRCIVKNCDGLENAVVGAAGTGANGSGYGLFITGGGEHLIEGNECYFNGGNGGSGLTTGGNGGRGSGRGIYIQRSNSNLVKGNVCYVNGARGGAAGTATNQPGLSVGAGIQIESVGANIATGNQVLENTCYDNDVTALASSTSDGGSAYSYGIALLGTFDSTIERNLCYGNDAFGGNSTPRNGGWGVATGILATGDTGITIIRNTVRNATATGGRTFSTSSAQSHGLGQNCGIQLDTASDSTVLNNLAFENRSNSTARSGAEQPGDSIACGILLTFSARCSVLNNTSVHNQSRRSSVVTANVISGQISIGQSSSDAVVKNNVAVCYDSVLPPLIVETTAQSGFIADYNDLYSTGGVVGGWGSSLVSGLSTWRTTTGQDAHSVAVDPSFYDVPADNYHLRYDSPLIDIGVNLSNVESDGDAEARPVDGRDLDLIATHDMGYDEFVDRDGDNLADVIETTVTLTNPTAVDSDLDGLPDGWEVANTLNPNSATGINGGSGDADGDGYTNLQEFLGNSNPRLASSKPAQPPVIGSASPSGANIQIEEEESVNFTATATDANGDAISYSWRQDGVVKSATSAWTFVTTNESSGPTTLLKEYQIELRVTAGTDVVTRQWTVLVNNRNHAPVLLPLANVTARAGDTVQLTPSYSDPDNANSVPGDDNLLTVQYSGFMTGPTKIVSAADGGIRAVTVTVQDNGNPVLSAQQTIQIQVIADGDNDGMADDWELANGLNRDNPNDAAADADGDGSKNVDEFIAGTNPQNPASKFRITSLARVGSDIVIGIPTVLGKRYRIERNDSLTGGTWTLVLDNIAGTNSLVQTTDVNGATAGRRFYRAVVGP